jgi:hypothetical protein
VVNNLIFIQLRYAVSSNIVPGQLSPLTNQNLYGYEAVIAAWGKTSNGETYDYMLEGTLIYLTKRECEERIEEITREEVPVHSRYLCTSAYPFILTQIVSIYLILFYSQFYHLLRF